MLIPPVDLSQRCYVRRQCVLREVLKAAGLTRFDSKGLGLAKQYDLRDYWRGDIRHAGCARVD